MELDKEYWEAHWRGAGLKDAEAALPPNPYLAEEFGAIPPGTALDAGCGEGAEAIWLATAGWHVVAADISSEVLRRAAARATSSGVPPERLTWVEADLSTWEPAQPFDLVTTHYAHPAMAQPAFYQRLADWVVPGGTMLVVGHALGHHGHDHGPPAEVSVTAASVRALFDTAAWTVVTAAERVRSRTNDVGDAAELHDVVVRATRRA